jgi:hypothetical protein
MVYRIQTGSLEARVDLKLNRLSQDSNRIREIVAMTKSPQRHTSLVKVRGPQLEHEVSRFSFIKLGSTPPAPIGRQQSNDLQLVLSDTPGTLVALKNPSPKPIHKPSFTTTHSLIVAITKFRNTFRFASNGCSLKELARNCNYTQDPSSPRPSCCTDAAPLSSFCV